MCSLRASVYSVVASIAYQRLDFSEKQMHIDAMIDNFTEATGLLGSSFSIRLRTSGVW